MSRFFVSPVSLFCLPPFIGKNKNPSRLLGGCLQVSDDSLSSHVYQSVSVQLSLPPTFCPLAFAVNSDDHSRFGSWKKHTDCEHTETQAWLLSLGISQHDRAFLFCFFFCTCTHCCTLPLSFSIRFFHQPLFSACFSPPPSHHNCMLTEQQSP